jgi:hypothetical protein
MDGGMEGMEGMDGGMDGAWTVGLDEGNCVADKQWNENWLPGLV